MTASITVATGLTESAWTTTRTIVLPERFDVHEVAWFDSEIDLAVGHATMLVIDASHVRYLDLRAMEALIAARLRCIDHGGELALANASVAARVTLELTGRYEALRPAGAALVQPFSVRDAA